MTDMMDTAVAIQKSVAGSTSTGRITPGNSEDIAVYSPTAVNVPQQVNNQIGRESPEPPPGKAKMGR